MANSSWSKNSKPRSGASALGKDFIPHMKAPRTEFPLFNGKRVTPSLAGLDSYCITTVWNSRSRRSSRFGNSTSCSERTMTTRI